MFKTKIVSWSLLLFLCAIGFAQQAPEGAKWNTGPKPPPDSTPRQIPDNMKRDDKTKIEARPEGPNPSPPALNSALIKDLMLGQAPDAKTPALRGHEWTNIEIWLSCAVLIFGVIAMVLASVVVMRTSSCWAPKDVLNLFGLILIVSGAVVLVTAGYSSQQITGVIGLLGSLGGYLLGSRSKE